MFKKKSKVLTVHILTGTGRNRYSSRDILRFLFLACAYSLMLLRNSHFVLRHAPAFAASMLVITKASPCHLELHPITTLCRQKVKKENKVRKRAPCANSQSPPTTYICPICFYYENQARLTPSLSCPKQLSIRTVPQA